MKTPQEEIAEVRRGLDRCLELVAPVFYDVAQNGLQQPWAGHTVFCNPPYGPVLRRFVAKAVEEGQRGVKSVLLIPPHVGTEWWARLVVPYAAVWFVTNRFRFGGSSGVYGYSCFCLFGPGWSTLAQRYVSAKEVRAFGS